VSQLDGASVVGESSQQ